ncbi:ATP dependent DNA ligase domain-containing protein [Ditylenchus destructor]|nr:ATP dependent DNA ligase domain-containing protein [Ditylenchus destructor]
MNALKAGDTGRLLYYAFDLLYLDGHDLRQLPLSRRRDLLGDLLLEQADPVRFSEHFEASGDVVKRHACQLKLEGIISKSLDDPYRSGRAGIWLKVKCSSRQEFVVAGYGREAAACRPGRDRLHTGNGAGPLRTTGGTARRDQPVRRPAHSSRAQGRALRAPGTGRRNRISRLEQRRAATARLLSGLREDKPAGEVAIEVPKPGPEQPEKRADGDCRRQPGTDGARGDRGRSRRLRARNGQAAACAQAPWPGQVADIVGLGARPSGSRPPEGRRGFVAGGSQTPPPEWEAEARRLMANWNDPASPLHDLRRPRSREPGIRRPLDGEVGLREGLDAIVMGLCAAHHALTPPIVDQPLGTHQRRHGADQHQLGDAALRLAMPHRVVQRLAAAGGMADMHRVAQIERLHHRRGIGRVVVHVMAITHLGRSAMAAAVMRDHAEALMQEEQHLRIPVIGAERPAVVEDDGLGVLRTPVLVEDLESITRRGEGHDGSPDLLVARCGSSGARGAPFGSRAADRRAVFAGLSGALFGQRRAVAKLVLDDLHQQPAPIGSRSSLKS